MSTDPRVVLSGFQDGRATLDIHYDGRHARLELDMLEDRYPGQPTEERVQEELARLIAAVESWLEPPVGHLERG